MLINETEMIFLINEFGSSRSKFLVMDFGFHFATFASSLTSKLHPSNKFKLFRYLATLLNHLFEYNSIDSNLQFQSSPEELELEPTSLSFATYLSKKSAGTMLPSSSPLAIT